MKTSIYRSWILILLAIVGYGKMADGSHLAGGELTYECLGNNVYRFKAVIYRDCSGVAPGSVFRVDYASGSCGQNGYFNLPIQSTSGNLIPYCPSAAQSSTCDNGPNLGIQKVTYVANFTVPANCTDWVFSHSFCCRNGSSNIVGAANPFYIDARLDNVNGGCNNSPQFTNDPIAYMLAGTVSSYSHGVTEADGDDLSFNLIAPMTGIGANLQYVAPFSAQNPISPVSGGLVFDPNTGNMTFSPGWAQESVTAIRVEEYRNGVLVGSVMRDIQIIVDSPGSNSNPTTSGVDNTNTFSIALKPGCKNCFEVFSNDVDAGQIVSMSWDGGVPGATFNITGSPHPKGTFCWNLTAADIREAPYVFHVTVQDDACPLAGTSTYAFSVYATNCFKDIYYEDRSAATNPLPDKTESSTFIKAGFDVTSTLSNGPVIVEPGQNVEFKAKQEIVLADGFTVSRGSDFRAFVDVNACPGGSVSNPPVLSLAVQNINLGNYQAAFDVVVGTGTDYVNISIAGTPYNKNYYMGTDFNCCTLNWSDLFSACVYSVCDDIEFVVTAYDQCDNNSLTRTVYWNRGGPPVAGILPNIITPNGDGINDELCFEISGADNYNLIVFNRWGGTTYSASGCISDDDACLWSPSPGSVADGTYFYVLTLTNECGESRIYSDNSLFITTGSSKRNTDADEEANVILNSTLEIYPNPASTTLFVSNLKEGVIYEAIIRDAKGGIVKKLSLRGHGDDSEIDLKSISGGLYLLEITGDGQFRNKSFVVE